MIPLRKLCGCTAAGDSRIVGVRNILGNEIEQYGVAAVNLLKMPADKSALSLYGCFTARKLLEAGCVALLSQIDPSRLLILREFQMKGDYGLSERHPAAIDWKVDVISEKKTGWKDAIGPDKFVRSLLGGHLAEIAWLDAISKIDTLPAGDSDKSSWIQKLVTEYSARIEQATEEAVDGADLSARTSHANQATLSGFRSNVKSLFSLLSKGVHLEFIIDSRTLFDIPTVTENMRKSIKILTQLSFISHLMDCTNAPMEIAEAAALVLEVEQALNVE